jgi:hypothetical protein
VPRPAVRTGAKLKSGPRASSSKVELRTTHTSRWSCSCTERSALGFSGRHSGWRRAQLCSACGGGARPLLRTASTCCVFGVGLEKEDEVVAEAEQEEKDAHSCSWNRC